MAPPVSDISFSTMAEADSLAHVRRWGEVQTGDRDAPTLATEGMDLRNVRGFVVSAAAAEGESFNEVGALAAWRYDAAVAGWCRVPAWDLAVTGTGAAQFIAWGEREVLVSAGRILYACSAMEVSSGNISVRIAADTGTA